MTESPAASFIARWQGQLTQSLADFAGLANDIEDVDFTTGILAAAVVWPIREPVREYDGDAADAVQQIAGAGAGSILKVVNQLPENRAAGAKALQAAAAEQPALRDGLVKLIDHFDAAQIFAEQLTAQIQTRYGDQSAGSTFNITEEIKAALVNIGGITNIKQLSVHLSLPAPETKQSRLKRWGAYTAGVIGLLASLLALVQFVIPLLGPRPEMTGGFNVAVAEFSKLDSQ